MLGIERKGPVSSAGGAEAECKNNGGVIGFDENAGVEDSRGKGPDVGSPAEMNGPEEDIAGNWPPHDGNEGKMFEDEARGC